MGRKLIVIGLFLTVVFAGKAQELNYPVANSKLPDGWHKFISAGAYYDVEILQGYLVKGNVTWFDKATYSGSFRNDKIYGRGTYTWPNGDRYEGSFKNNMRHGKGTMYWADGTKYSGKWKNNSRNGKGKLFNNEGKLTDEGVWEADVLVSSKK
ncbi:hypothetical protein GCM10009430_41800 [Aquimarina litoralis]|uniref:MORN repeat-containing protein n=1 Tax=Aquimarina litoralis TaxID=584605 RepID=A0ABN1J6T2_9FLAO